MKKKINPFVNLLLLSAVSFPLILTTDSLHWDSVTTQEKSTCPSYCKRDEYTIVRDFYAVVCVWKQNHPFVIAAYGPLL